MTRTIARLYDSFEDAAKTIRELEAAGIPVRDISLIANNDSNSLSHHVRDSRDLTDHDRASAASTGAGVGAVAGGGAGLLAGLGMLAIPGLGPVVAAGWLAAAAVGAVAGAAAGAIGGSLVDMLTQQGVSEEHAHVYAEGVRRGGTLITVRIEDDRTGLVESIMERNRTVDPAARRKVYAESGWNRFDPNAGPYAGTRPRDTLL